jgi:large subunit ribosomal protein L15e
MSFTKHLQGVWRNPSKDLLKDRIIEWRKGLGITRIDRPTRLDRARNIGYKAKKGYILVRVRVLRGGRQRAKFKKGRRSKTRRRLKIVSKSYQRVAEERAAKKFKNCEVLNSYNLAKDGKYGWYEVILLDREIVKNYAGMEWITRTRGRTFQGRTSEGRKNRGLNNKGKGAEKIRPSLKANKRRAH